MTVNSDAQEKRHLESHNRRWKDWENQQNTHNLNSLGWNPVCMNLNSLNSTLRNHTAESRISSTFFGAFAKLQMATIKLRHVRLPVFMSVRMKQLGSHWTDFHEILYLRSFPISVKKIQVSLKSDKSNGYFTRRPICVDDKISLDSSYNENYFTQKL